MAQYGEVGGTFNGYPSKTFFNPSTGQQTLIFFFNGSPLSRIPAGYYEKNDTTYLQSTLEEELGDVEQLEFELNNTISTSNLISLGTTVGGALSSKGDIDSFMFEVSQAQGLTINFTLPLSSELGVSEEDYFNIRLSHDLDQNGYIDYTYETYLESDITAAAQKAINVGQTGFYFLEISADDNKFSDEDYSFNVVGDLDTAPPELISVSLIGNEFENGDAISGTIQAYDASGISYASVVFIGPDGEEFKLELSESDQEGVFAFSDSVPINAELGTYTLQFIALDDASDSTNMVDYVHDGTMYGGSLNGAELADVDLIKLDENHSFDFSDYDFEVVEQKTNTNPVTNIPEYDKTADLFYLITDTEPMNEGAIEFFLSLNADALIQQISNAASNIEIYGIDLEMQLTSGGYELDGLETFWLTNGGNRRTGNINPTQQAFEEASLYSVITSGLRFVAVDTIPLATTADEYLRSLNGIEYDFSEYVASEFYLGYPIITTDGVFPDDLSLHLTGSLTLSDDNYESTYNYNFTPMTISLTDNDEITGDNDGSANLNNATPSIDLEYDYFYTDDVISYTISDLTYLLNFEDTDGDIIQGISLRLGKNMESEHEPIFSFGENELFPEIAYSVFFEDGDASANKFNEETAVTLNLPSDNSIIEITASDEFSIIDGYISAYDGTNWSDWDHFELVSVSELTQGTDSDETFNFDADGSGSFLFDGNGGFDTLNLTMADVNWQLLNSIDADEDDPEKDLTIVLDEIDQLNVILASGANWNSQDYRAENIIFGEGNTTVWLNSGPANNFTAGSGSIDLLDANVSGITEGVTFDLKNEVVSRTDGYDIISGFEWFNGTPYDDKFYGKNDGNDHLPNFAEVFSSVKYIEVAAAFEDADALDNFFSVEIFYPGDGSDMLDGGSDGAVVHYNAGADFPANGITGNLEEGFVIDPWGEVDQLNNIHSIVGTASSDNLIGSPLDDYFSTRNGNDAIDGGNGNDTISYSRADKVVANLGANEEAFENYAELFSTSDLQTNLLNKVYFESGSETFTDNITNIENLIATEGIDGIYGNSSNNTFSGLAGDDWVFGGDGADIIFGGAGDDHLDGGNHDDIIMGQSGSDTIRGGSGYDTVFFTGLENDYTVIRAGDHTIVSDKRSIEIDKLWDVEHIVYADTIKDHSQQGNLDTVLYTVENSGTNSDQYTFSIMNGLNIDVSGEGADGTINIALFDDVAPLHSERLAALANEGAYDNVAFHRVIDGFMAQTGDVQYGAMDGNLIYAGRGGSTYEDLNAEFSDIPFDRGVVGMARSSDPDSANSQFFMMFEDDHFLNGQYTVVGEVASGLDVLDTIKRGDASQNGAVSENPDYMKEVTYTPAKDIFEINSASGEITFSGEPDFEDVHFSEVIVAIDDGSSLTYQTLNLDFILQNADSSNTASFSLTSHTNSADWDFYVGTELADKITGQSDSVYLGLDGDDEFVSGLNAEHQVFIGLEGADTYEISERGAMSIVEIDDGSKNVLEATGIGFNSTTTYALTIDNQKHLVVGDTVSGQEIYLIDWDEGNFDSSIAILSDGEYSGEFISDVILTRPNYLGDFSWEELAQQGVDVTPNIRNVIADTRLWAEGLSKDGDNDNDSSNPSDVDAPVFQSFSGNGNEVSYNENDKQLNIKTADGIDLMATLPQRSDVVEYEQQDYHYAYEFNAAISNTAAIVSYSGERDYRGEILGQVYGFDGSRIGDEILFSSQTDQGHRSSIWTIDGDRFLALWQTNNPDWLPPLDDMVGYVVGRVYNASDNSLEDTFVVAAQTNLLDTPPSIEISNTGAFNISWSEYDLTGDQLGASEMVYGGEINELISGSASADYLYGQGGDDEIDGGAGDDLIDGGVGDDILTGGDGDDIIIAGDGEDLIIGGNGEGDDIYDGGSGSDTIKYTSARAGITVDLESGLAFSSNADEDAEIGRDAISAVENIIAGDFSDYLFGSVDANIIQAGDGSDLILAGAGNDTIIVGGSQTFSSSYQAVNTSSTTQVGTGDKVTLEGMLRVEDVIDGGADTDTIELGEGNVSLFLHDALSGFHSSVELGADSTGEQNKARLENIEQITGNDSDVNIIDLTSPDYSLAGQIITVDGAGGRDIIWGSDADEIIIGGDGDDEIFGGTGTNVLTGGLGADEFQFTMTSTNDSVTDFNAAEGDTLKFFNTGGATFDRDSVTANSEGNGISIEYSLDNQTLSLDISLGLSSISDTDELLSAIEII